MIDSLPLDLFGEDEPEHEESADTPVSSTCLWCSAAVAPDARICHACGARIVPIEPPKPRAHEGICQWCAATIAPDDEACPECGWDAIGDNETEMPGITTPLSESQLQSLYGDDEEAGLDIGDGITLAAEIIGLILPNG